MVHLQRNAPAGARLALLARVELDDDELAARVAGILQDAAPAAPALPYLTTREAAEYMRCTRQRVFDLTSQGRLRVRKDGSRSLYHRDDLDAHLEALPGLENGDGPAGCRAAREITQYEENAK